MTDLTLNLAGFYGFCILCCLVVALSQPSGGKRVRIGRCALRALRAAYNPI
jgi:hypothetical protein